MVVAVRTKQGVLLPRRREGNRDGQSDHRARDRNEWNMAGCLVRASTLGVAAFNLSWMHSIVIRRFNLDKRRLNKKWMTGGRRLLADRSRAALMARVSPGSAVGARLPSASACGAAGVTLGTAAMTGGRGVDGGRGADGGRGIDGGRCVDGSRGVDGGCGVDGGLGVDGGRGVGAVPLFAPHLPSGYPPLTARRTGRPAPGRRPPATPVVTGQPSRPWPPATRPFSSSRACCPACGRRIAGPPPPLWPPATHSSTGSWSPAPHRVVRPPPAWRLPSYLAPADPVGATCRVDAPPTPSVAVLTPR